MSAFNPLVLRRPTPVDIRTTTPGGYGLRLKETPRGWCYEISSARGVSFGGPFKGYPQALGRAGRVVQTLRDLHLG